MAAEAPDRRGFRRVLSIPATPTPGPRPCATREESLARFAELSAMDDDRVGESTRSRLFEPEGAAIATVVVFHGFTNAPSQWSEVAPALVAEGYRVLLPRQPYHGFSDVLSRSLGELRVEELTSHVDLTIDIAAGFGDPVWVVGLSAGGVLAAWAGATRSEVRRVVLMAPLVSPKGFPLPVVRVLVRSPKLVPKMYNWWDPRKKDKLGHSPHAYPGFPLPGIMPYLHLSEAMFGSSVTVGHQLERVVLTTNPGDVAIRRDAARKFAEHVFGGHCDYFGEANVDGELGWGHDFVDPWAPDRGTAAQVVDLLQACFGVADPKANGVLVAPLLEALDASPMRATDVDGS